MSQMNEPDFLSDYNAFTEASKFATAQLATPYTGFEEFGLPTAEDILKDMPGRFETDAARLKFSETYNEGIRKLTEVSDKSGFFTSLFAELGSVEDLMLQFQDMGFTEETMTKEENDAFVSAMQRVRQTRRALERRDGGFFTEAGTALGEVLNEVTAPLLVGTAAGSAVAPGVGSLIGGGAGALFGMGRLAMRVFDMSHLEYEDELAHENARRRKEGLELLDYNGDDAFQRATGSVATEAALELVTLGAGKYLKPVGKAGQRTLRSQQAAASRFAREETSYLVGQSRQLLRDIGKRTVTEMGKEAFEEGMAGAVNDLIAEVVTDFDIDRFDPASYFRDAAIGAVTGGGLGTGSAVGAAQVQKLTRVLERRRLGPKTRRVVDMAYNAVDVENNINDEIAEFSGLDDAQRKARVKSTAEAVQQAEKAEAEARANRDNLIRRGKKDQILSDSLIDEANAEVESQRMTLNKFRRQQRMQKEVFGMTGAVEATSETTEQHLERMSRPLNKSEDGAAGLTPFTQAEESSLTEDERATVRTGSRLGVQVVFVDGGEGTQFGQLPAWYSSGVSRADDGKGVVFLRRQESLSNLRDVPASRGMLRGLVVHETVHYLQHSNPALYNKIRSLIDDTTVVAAAAAYLQDSPVTDAYGRPATAKDRAAFDLIGAVLEGQEVEATEEAAEAAARIEVEGVARALEEASRGMEGKVNQTLASFGIFGREAKQAAEVLKVLEAAAASGEAIAEGTLGRNVSALLRINERVEGESSQEIQEAEEALGRAEQLAADAETREAHAEQQKAEEEILETEEMTEAVRLSGFSEEPERVPATNPADVSAARVASIQANIYEPVTRGDLIDENLKRWAGNTTRTTPDGALETLYHGTDAMFAEDALFDTKRGELGLHLTSDPRVANYFARRGGTVAGEGARVYPVYVRLENPLRLTDPMIWNSDTVAGALASSMDVFALKEEALDHINSFQSQAFQEMVEDAKAYPEVGPSGIRVPRIEMERLLKSEREFQRFLSLDSRLDTRMTQLAIEALGYDGVVYLNRAEAVKMVGRKPKVFAPAAVASDSVDDAKAREILEREGFEARDSYIVFNPSQVKSATGNNGSYSLESPYINKARIGRNLQSRTAPLDQLSPRDQIRFRAAGRQAARLNLEKIAPSTWIETLQQSPHRTTLTIPSMGEVSRTLPDGSPVYQTFRIPGTDIVYAMKRIVPGRGETFDGFEITGLLNMEEGLRSPIPILIGHAIMIADGKPIRGDWFDVRRPGSPKGKLPYLYQQEGMRVVDNEAYDVEWAKQNLTPEVFAAQLAAWESDGWNPEYDDGEPQFIGEVRIPSNLPPIQYGIWDGATESELDRLRQYGLRGWLAISAERANAVGGRARVAGTGVDGVELGVQELGSTGAVSERGEDVGRPEGEAGVADGVGDGEPTGAEADRRDRAGDPVQAGTRRGFADRLTESEKQGVSPVELALAVEAEANDADLTKAASMLIGLDMLPDQKWLDLHKAWKESKAPLLPPKKDGEVQWDKDHPAAKAFREYADLYSQSFGLPGRNHSQADGSAQASELQRLLDLRSQAASQRIANLSQIAGKGVEDAETYQELLTEALALGILEVHNRAGLNQATEWYSHKIETAMEIIRDRVPGLKVNDPQAKENEIVFGLFLAVLSNGQDVPKNMEQAIVGFRKWAETGEFPVGGAYRDNSKQFTIMEQLRDHFGSWEAVGEWLKTPGSISEINANLKILRKEMQDAGIEKPALPDSIGGELASQDGYNSLVLGPKLGAFWLNLNGVYNPLTMDLWFTRTLGRQGGISTQYDPMQEIRFTAKLLEAKKHFNRNAKQHRAWMKEQDITDADRAVVDEVFDKVDAGTVTEADLLRLEKFADAKIVRKNDVQKVGGGKLVAWADQFVTNRKDRNAVKRLAKKSRAGKIDDADIAEARAIAERMEDEVTVVEKPPKNDRRTIEFHRKRVVVSIKGDAAWAVSIHKFNPEFASNKKRDWGLYAKAGNGSDPVAFIKAAIVERNAYGVDGFKEEDPVKKAVMTPINTYLKTRDQTLDAPGTGEDRAELRTITKRGIARANEMLEAEGRVGNISNAAAQADLWYFEKGLYFTHVHMEKTYGDPSVQDFAVAADAATKKLGYDRGDGPSLGPAEPDVSSARVNPFVKTEGVDMQSMPTGPRGTLDTDELYEGLSKARIVTRSALERRLQAVERKLLKNEQVTIKSGEVAGQFFQDAMRDIVEEQRDLLRSRQGMSPALAAMRGMEEMLAVQKVMVLAERRNNRIERTEKLRELRSELRESREEAIGKIKAEAEAKREALKGRMTEQKEREIERERQAAERKYDKAVAREQRYEEMRRLAVDVVTDHLPVSVRGKYLKALSQPRLTANQIMGLTRRVYLEAAKVDARGQRVRANTLMKQANSRKMADDTRQKMKSLIEDAIRLTTSAKTAKNFNEVENLTEQATEKLNEAKALYESDRQAFRDERNNRGLAIADRIERIVAAMAGGDDARRLGRALGSGVRGEMASALGRRGALDLRAGLREIGLSDDHAVLAAAEDRMKSDSRDLIESANRIVKQRGFRDFRDFMARTSGSKGLGRQEFRVFKYRDEAGNQQEITITLGQAMKLVALDEHTLGQLRGKVRRAGGKSAEDAKVQELAFQVPTDGAAEPVSIKGADLVGDIEAFRQGMKESDPDIVGVVKDLKDLRGKMLKPKAMSALYRLTGNIPPVTKDYEPRKVKGSSIKKVEEVLNIGGGAVGPQFAENAGFTIKRVGGGVTVVGDMMSDFLEHADQSLKLAHMAEPTRVIWSALSDPQSAEAIENVLGTTGVRNLRTHLAYATGLIPSNMNPGPLGQIVAIGAGTAIAANPETFVKVALGGLNNLLLSDTFSLGMLANGMARAAQLLVSGKFNQFYEDKVLANSGYFWDRDHSSAIDRRIVFTRDDGLASEKDVTDFTDIFQTAFASFGSLLDSLKRGDRQESLKHLGDIRNAIASTPKAIRVLRHLDRFIVAAAVLGRNEADAVTKDDVFAASLDVRNTQNTSSPLDDARVTAVQRVNASPAAYILTFSSDPLKTQSRIMETENTPDNLKKTAVAVLGNGGISILARAMSTAVIASLLLDDEDEADKVLEELNKQRLADGLDKTLIEEVFTRKAGPLGFIFSRVMGNLANEVENAATVGTRIDPRRLGTEATEALMPIGVPSVIDIFEQVAAVSTEPDEAKRSEAWERLLVLSATIGLGQPIGPLRKYYDPLLTETSRAEVRSADYQLRKMLESDDLPPEVREAIRSANREYAEAKKLRDRE